MAYEVDHSAVADQVALWPDDARARFDEALVVLELTPWNSRPANRSNPSGQSRFPPFDTSRGSGFIYFVIVASAPVTTLHRPAIPCAKRPDRHNGGYTT